MIFPWEVAFPKKPYYYSHKLNIYSISYILIWGFLIVSWLRIHLQCRRPPVWFLGEEILWRMDRRLTPVFLGFACGSAGKESICNAGDLDSILGLGRSTEKGKATHSSILAWRIPWTVSPWSCKESDTTGWLLLSLYILISTLYI